MLTEKRTASASGSENNEGTHQWLSIFDELKSRGVERLGFVCIDGLQGLEEAITNTFPTAVVCRCMVHLVRNSTKYIPSKCRKEFCADLKGIYGAVSKEAAEAALSKLNEKWKDRYPSAVRVWNEGFCYVERLFAYPSEIRKMIYTTNTIESFNSALRKVTNRKAAFPNAAAVMKVLYLRTLDVAAKWVILVFLIIGKRFCGGNQHSRRPGRTQSSIHFIQNAGRGSRTEQMHNALRQTQIKQMCIRDRSYARRCRGRFLCAGKTFS